MLKKFYHLSDTAQKTIVRSGIGMAVFNLATLLPAIPLAMITDQMIARHLGWRSDALPLWGYLGIASLLLVLIFISYRITYGIKYLTSMDEDKRLRMGLANKIRRLPLSYIGQRDLSDLTSTIMDDVAVIEAAIANGVSEFIGGFLSGILAILLLSFYNVKMAISLGICLPLSALAMVLCRLISEGTNKRNRQKKLDISEGLQEYLENIKPLQTSKTLSAYQHGLSYKIRRVLSGLILYEFLAGSAVSLSYNVMRIGLGLCILTGSQLLIAGELSQFGFFLFLYVAVRIYDPLSKAGEMLGTLIFSLVSAKRIRNLMNYPEQGGEDLQPSSFDITFDHVHFGYHEDILHDISFTAKQGQITALVGLSGSGKSTICKLAARFWDVERGTVSLGGIDVKRIAPEALMRNYSIVFQDVVLFNDTIYNNIKIGKQDATREEVLAAAKLARCDEFIASLPDGYDTVVGENGKTLSGGERQRLSIARAFLKDAPVILLDESTASIDPRNETKIQQAIGQLIQNKTVLIIAHKLRSIVECDQIIVLKDGKIEERGTHAELMQRRGFYHHLYSIQTESLKWNVRSSFS
ncbi:MAG: ABC transporter ATP-binding protein [Bacillota bacterium]|nr:ABC transporter ATP-binding protein [Bacillota bacterium]